MFSAAAGSAFRATAAAHGPAGLRDATGIPAGAQGYGQPQQGNEIPAAAGVLAGKKVTAYTDYENVLTSAREFVEEPAVYDQNVITSVGPATPYPFAFAILEALGIDPSSIKERMLYTLAKGR